MPTQQFISKSKTKIWLSVALQTKEQVKKLSGDDFRKLLESNVDTSRCHFMIEGGWLKIEDGDRQSRGHSGGLAN